MKKPIFLSLLVAMLCAVPAFAYNTWTEWRPLQKNEATGRDALIEASSTKEEDSPNGPSILGTLFYYRIRNLDTEHAAKVTLFLPKQDSISNRWSEMNPVEFVISPGASLDRKTCYSPDPNNLEYKATIIWDDEPGYKRGKTAPEAEDPIRDGTNQAEANLGVPLDDFPAVLTKLKGMTDMVDVVLAASLVSVPPVNQHISWKEEVRKYVEISLPSMGFLGEIVSTEGEEVKIRFNKTFISSLSLLLSSDGVIGINGLGHQIRFRFVSLSLSRLQTNEAPQNGSAAAQSSQPFRGNGDLSEEGIRGKIVQSTSTPSKASKIPKSGGFSAPASAPVIQNQGYWFDPSDKDSHAGETNPVIYVLINGGAKRVRLSEAKSQYGVPASANRDTMTQWSEKTGVLLFDRGTVH